MVESKCLIYGASQIVQVVRNGESYLRGASKGIKNLAVLTKTHQDDTLCIVSYNGEIKFVGKSSDDEFVKNYKDVCYDTKIDASNCSIVPGLIDSHTHPIWEGDRVNEFKMKLEGAGYMEIHKAGGGINFTVRHTKEASEDQLYSSLIRRLENFSKTGTTFVECKSGYGLEWDVEHKLLKVLTKAKRELKWIGISNTYLGAHSVPTGKTADEATSDIVNNDLTRLKDLMDAKELDVDNIDVFCEKGVFDVAQTEAILKQAECLSLNLNVNFHSNELFPLNSVEMAVRLKSKAVSHLEETSESEIDLMSKSETVGIILPTTAIIMQLKRPPVKQMLRSGCIIALGSDFNPNAYCYSMPLIMSLACVDMRMSLSEALAASTINSAFALGVEKQRGSIEVGKRADLLILNSEKWEHLIYQIGAHDSLIKHVLVDGQVIEKR